jgi:hypothetical protein
MCPEALDVSCGARASCGAGPPHGRLDVAPAVAGPGLRECECDRAGDVGCLAACRHALHVMDHVPLVFQAAD